MTPEIHDGPDERIMTGQGAPVAQIREGNVKLLPWLMFIAWSSGVAFALSIASGMVAWWNIKEAKQVQVQLMYTNALMIREGMVKPGDMVFGPEGNMEYDGSRFHKPKEKP